MAYVCAGCFSDPDIREYIKSEDCDEPCDFCGHDDDESIEVDDLGAHLRECLQQYYGFAQNVLFYDDESESGYAGEVIETGDLLFNRVGVDLPRDDYGVLASALEEAVNPGEWWCEANPGGFPEDEALLMDWEHFCEFVKKHRGALPRSKRRGRESWNDIRTPREVLDEIARLIERYHLIADARAGSVLYRGRADVGEQRYATPRELGPPLSELAVRPNRMNRAGDPMFYGADRVALVDAELGGVPNTIGAFVIRRDLRLLDLVSLPPRLGIFGRAKADRVLITSFLHEFARRISRPVDRDGSRAEEYIPTQVLTADLRDRLFDGGRINGILYRSATGVAGNNIVLFATQEDIVGGGSDPTDGWLELQDASPREEALAREYEEDRRREAAAEELKRQPRLEGLPLFDGGSLQGA